MNNFLQAYMLGGRDSRQLKMDQIAEQDRARQQQIQDLAVLERLNRAGRPVTAGTVTEMRPIDQTMMDAMAKGNGAGMVLPPELVSQPVQVTRPVDRSRLAEHTLADGRKMMFELYSPEDQTQMAIDAMIRKQQAANAQRDADEQRRAIPTPKFMQGAWNAPTVKPSQFSLFQTLAGQVVGEEANAARRDVAKTTMMGRALEADARAKGQVDVQRERDKGALERTKVTASSRITAAQIAASRRGRGGGDAGGGGRPSKDDAKTAKDVERLKNEAKKAQQAALEFHALAEDTGKLWRQGIFAEKGKGKMLQGRMVPADAENAKLMQVEIDQYKRKAAQLERQRDAHLAAIKAMLGEEE